MIVAILVGGGIVIAIVSLIYYSFPLKQRVFPKVTDAIYHEETRILWVKWSNGTEQHFKGSCTVWYTYPMMCRCTTSIESELCNLWAYIKEHGNPYPTAHLKKDGNKAHT